LQFFGVLSLLLEFLGLEKMVEGWNDFSIDLFPISKFCEKGIDLLSHDQTKVYMLLEAQGCLVEGVVGLRQDLRAITIVSR
jgi:hypothetical protein